MYDTSLFVDKVETPAYVVDEACLLANLQILDGVRKRTGAKILLAQKAFSMYSLYPLIGEYLDGTTDITRTIVLGALTKEEKTDYTLVLKGFIQLSMAQFPHGTCGTQLDALARLPMWKAGINYLHGTGHGVGCFLNVHEGPHQFRMNHMPALLVPGMTVTNEPGIYKTGRHGVRTENTMLIVPSQETEFGTYYKFEPLTLCPIDKEAILTDMLSDEEITWFNQYHEKVYNCLNPELNNEEREWLKEVTSPLKR